MVKRFNKIIPKAFIRNFNSTKAVVGFYVKDFLGLKGHSPGTIKSCNVQLWRFYWGMVEVGKYHYRAGYYRIVWV